MTRCLRGCALDYTAAVTMPGDPALELGERLSPLPMPRPNAGDPPGVEVPRRNDAERRGQNPYPAGAATHTDAQLRSLQQADANKIMYYSFTNGSDIKEGHGRPTP